MRVIIAWAVALSSAQIIAISQMRYIDQFRKYLASKQTLWELFFGRKQSVWVLLLAVAGGILFYPCLFMSVFFLADTDCFRPSDQELIDKFEQNQTNFQTLLDMFLSDKGLERVDYDWTSPDNPQDVGVSPERIAEYHQYFDKLGLPNGIIGFGKKDNISFPIASCGIAVSGTSQGYAYVQTIPELLVDSIEDYRHGKFESYIIYRHIVGNWYLYYDFED